MKKNLFLISCFAVLLSSIPVFNMPPVSASILDVNQSLQQGSVSNTRNDSNAPKNDALRGIVTPGLDDVKVRSSAWGPVIGKIYSGKFVEIKAEEGDWYIIDYEGRKGYILKQALLTNSGEKSKITEIEESGTVTVSNGYTLNVRASAWGDRIGKLKNGDKVEIIGSEGDWYKIKFNGREGYIYKAYVRAQKGKKSEPAITSNNNTRQPQTPKSKPPATTTTKDTNGNDNKTASPGIKGTKGFESGGLLNVPERAQRAPENGAAGNSYCGPTSIGMALDFYGINKSTKSIANICIGPGGTNAYKALSTIKELGLPGSYMKEGASIDWLKQVTDSGKPVIVNVDTQGYWAPGHYMVVTGVKDGKVFVNDPWKGSERSYSFAAFKAQWATRNNRGIVAQP